MRLYVYNLIGGGAYFNDVIAKTKLCRAFFVDTTYTRPYRLRSWERSLRCFLSPATTMTDVLSPSFRFLQLPLPRIALSFSFSYERWSVYGTRSSCHLCHQKHFSKRHFSTSPHRMRSEIKFWLLLLLAVTFSYAPNKPYLKPLARYALIKWYALIK